MLQQHSMSEYRHDPGFRRNRADLRYALEYRDFFQVTKSYLKLGSEFQGRSFDQLISQTALQQLMDLFLEMTRAKTKKNKTSVLCQLQDWIASLSSYIKGLFQDLSCES
ncbi:UNVERIFIED_CONTAM: hypothetical protein ABIC26_001332 [Paenibacillus sp. PvR008]